MQSFKQGEVTYPDGSFGCVSGDWLWIIWNTNYLFPKNGYWICFDVCQNIKSVSFYFTQKIRNNLLTQLFWIFCFESIVRIVKSYLKLKLTNTIVRKVIFLPVPCCIWVSVLHTFHKTTENCSADHSQTLWNESVLRC